MSMVLGIDPGPTSCGVVLYDQQTRHALEAHKALELEELLSRLADPRDRWTYYLQIGGLVAIERVQSYGIAGASLLLTAETVGRLQQQALQAGHRVQLVTRREVLAALDITGKGNRDALVRQRCLEIHGGTRQAAIGRKATPGPLYGVAGHAWQALGVALALASR